MTNPQKPGLTRAQWYRKMIRVFVILATSLLVSAVGQPQKIIEQIRLRATVQDIVLLSHFSGKIVPVDFDPRFALTVRIQSVDPVVANFTEGAVIAFAIHSPSLLFGDEATKGKTYDFWVHREIKHRKTRYFGLRVEKVQTPSAVPGKSYR